MTRPPARPTLKDVASAANVSISTVSYALNDQSRVRLAADTRARVRRIAKDLGYTPNGIARSLRARSSRTAGVVISKPLTNPRYAAIVQGIGTALTELGFRMSVLPDVTGESFLADCRSGVLDGLVFVGHDDVEVPSSLAAAAADGSSPLVTIDCGAPEADATYSSVDFAYESGAEGMIRRLAEQGITTILHLRPEVPSRAERQRQAAMMRVLGEVDGITLRVISTGLRDEDLRRAERSPEAIEPYLRTETARLAPALESVESAPERTAVLCSWGADVEAALSVARTRAPGVTIASLAAGVPRVELWDELVYSSLPLVDAGHRAAHLLAAVLSPDPIYEHVLLEPVLTPPAAPRR